MDNGRCEKSRVEEEMKDGVFDVMTGMKNEVETQKVNDHKLGARSSETEQLGFMVEKVSVNSEEKGPRTSDHGVDECISGVRMLEYRGGKGHAEVKKPRVYEYDTMISMFDEYAANNNGKAVGSSGKSTSVGCGYEIGDMVWGSVKSHPWWPGHIYNETVALPSVRRTKREGHVLVAFFGDSSYGWFDPAELIPFDPNYFEKSRQTNMRPFVEAVEEAVDEVSRRCGLALACRCQNPSNFRPTNGQGYFVVDVGDSEPAGVYSMTQIRKSRESFRSRDTIAFVKQLALTPRCDGCGSIDFIKNKATVMAYRKAVFEKFDETYAQAFRAQPGRPTREQISAGTQPFRAPLSGPMVFAEALGKRKNSKKHNKAKHQPDNNKFLFRRRDESNEVKILQTAQTTSMHLSNIEGSMELETGSFVLQKRAPAYPPKQQIPAKLERLFPPERNSPSASSRVLSIEDKPVAARFSVPGSLANGSMVERLSGSGNCYPVKPAPDYTSPLLEPKSSRSAECFRQPPNLAAKVEQTHGIDTEFHGQDSSMRVENGEKKTKLVKCPVGEFFPEKSALAEKKKKRKKELCMDMGMQKRDFTGKACLPVREDLRIEHQKKDDAGNNSSLFSDSLRPPSSTIGMEYPELKLPQLLDGLQALAINPFRTMKRNSPAIVRQAFLNFRSLVFQKSLAMSSSSETRSHEIPPPENVKDLPSPNPPKPLVRAHDPTEGGQKRVPSGRQEEMVAKRVKRVKDIKSLPVERKAAERNLESQRDGKETVCSRPTKCFKPDSVLKKDSLGKAREPTISVMNEKKLESLRDGKETVISRPTRCLKPVSFLKKDSPGKAREPTILVMKFPPNTMLPSRFELKARLARFGPLDHSHTRISWKSSQIRVVFIHRADAKAAHRHLMGNNTLFGNVNMSCSFRPLEATAPESETRIQREDGPMETPQSGDCRVEQWPAEAVQLKSCLKKPVGDEAAVVAEGGSNGGGGGRGSPRVQFLLGARESNRGGEQVMPSNIYLNINKAATTLGGGCRGSPHVEFISGGEENSMDSNKKNFNCGSFADGRTSSLSHGMNFSSRNFQKSILPPLLPLPQFQKARSDLRYAQTAHRTNKFHAVRSLKNVDISHEMLRLLMQCNDVVSNLVCNLGYRPYRPL